MTTKKSYRRYSPEFKREAIKRACEEGMTDAAVCKELGISTRQFRRWRDELHLLGEDAFPGAGRSKDDEVTRLKRELAKVKQERDFLRAAITPGAPALSPHEPKQTVSLPVSFVAFISTAVGSMAALRYLPTYRMRVSGWVVTESPD